jgi:hypothetical protein
LSRGGCVFLGRCSALLGGTVGVRSAGSSCAASAARWVGGRGRMADCESDVAGRVPAIEHVETNAFFFIKHGQQHGCAVALGTMRQPLNREGVAVNATSTNQRTEQSSCGIFFILPLRASCSRLTTSPAGTSNHMRVQFLVTSLTKLISDYCIVFKPLICGDFSELVDGADKVGDLVRSVWPESSMTTTRGVFDKMDDEG